MTSPTQRTLSITVHGCPAPQGSKRHVGRGVMVESSKAVQPWREAVKYAALAAIAKTPAWQPLDEPISLFVTFYLKRPKKPKMSAPASAPDLSKLIRSTEDALTDAGVWRDDARVVQVLATKRWDPDGFVGAEVAVCWGPLLEPPT